MISSYEGNLEIDHDRGVIYFHQLENENMQPTLLRICGLGKIPQTVEHIDITHMFGVQVQKAFDK